MPLLLAAKVWHYWISFAMIGLALVTVVALGIGYVMRVVAPKYPRAPRPSRRVRR
jgi:hypothetical protein